MKYNFSIKTQAILLMIGTMFTFSLMDACAKYLTQDVHTIQVVWGRYFFQVVWAVIWLFPRLPVLLRTTHLKLQLLRSGFLFGATMCFFFSLSFLSMAETIATFELAPLMITGLAAIVLHETVGLRRWIAVGFGLIGALIIIRPGADVFSIYSIIPIGAALCYSGYAISTRFLGRGENPWTSFLYTAFVGTFIACLIVPFVWTSPDLRIWGVMILMGGLAAIGHYLLIRAFSLTEASFLAPFGYVSLIFNTLWGFLFFMEIPALTTVVGATIIVVAGLYVWYRESQDDKASSEAAVLPE